MNRRENLMKKVVVTGASGFVGGYLVRELIANHIKVISVVRNLQSSNENLPANDSNRIIYCDSSNISDLSNLINDRDIDAFYCLAWEGTSGQNRIDYEIQLKNAIFYIQALEVSKILGCKKFIGIGSISEMESLLINSVQGKRPPKLSFYGASKLYANMMTKALCASLDIEHIWVSITNTYGPKEKSERFIITTLKNIMNNNELILTSGYQLYDFIFVGDVARALYLILLNIKIFV